LTNSTPHLYI